MRMGASAPLQAEPEAARKLKLPIARVLGATWQRCRVHWMRNALAHVGKAQQSMAAAALRQAFLQPDQESARQTWRHVAAQLRPRWPKLGKLMDDSEDDVLAYMAYPPQHRTKLHSTNTLERLNNDEGQMQHQYMGVEAMGEMLNPTPRNEPLQLPPKAA
jgi:transposase-like protein